MVGNVMIDVLFAQLPTARGLHQPQKLGVEPGNYVLWTMHRPANVDDPVVLAGMMQAMQRTAARGVPVVFPCHPRTKARLEQAGLLAELDRSPGVLLGPPLGYLEFLGMSSAAKAIVTDSGGLQEESTVLGIPCLTMRENTERPITVTQGTSTLVGRDYQLLEKLLADILDGRYKQGSSPSSWDGKAGERVGKEVAKFLNMV
jgi:UDP-N-acetylglucosamine 2-epimerase (non-hydrolysing)